MHKVWCNTCHGVHLPGTHVREEALTAPPLFPARDEHYERRIRIWRSDDPTVKLWDEAIMIAERHAPSGTGGVHTEVLHEIVHRIVDDLTARRASAFKVTHDAHDAVAELSAGGTP